MFCGKCGNKCDEGMTFCGKCGTPVAPTAEEQQPEEYVQLSNDTPTEEASVLEAPTPEVQTQQSTLPVPVAPLGSDAGKNNGVFEVGPVKISGVNEDEAFIDLGGTVISAKWIFMGISGVMALLFFFPLFRVVLPPTGWWGAFRINGFTALFGRDSARGSFPALFILLIPVLVALLFYFKPQIEKQILFVKNNLFIIAAAGYVIGFIVLHITRISLNGIYVSASTTFFFFILMLGYLGAIALTVLFILSSKGIGLKVELGGNQSSVPPMGESGTGVPVPYVPGSSSSYIGVRRSGISVLLLSIVTCGIYLFYWYYTVMEDINKASGEPRMNSVALLIGTILCAPVAWVMLYQMDKNIARLAQENGTYYKENFILWLLLTFLCGIGTIVAMFQICSGLNELWNKRTFATPPSATE